MAAGDVFVLHGGSEKQLHLADVGQTVDGEQGIDLQFCSRLFPGFAAGALFSAFFFFHVAGGQGPIPSAGRDGASTKENRFIPGGDGTDKDLGVVIENAVAGGAHPAFSFVSRGDSQFHPATAFCTKRLWQVLLFRRILLDHGCFIIAKRIRERKKRGMIEQDTTRFLDIMQTNPVEKMVAKTSVRKAVIFDVDGTLYDAGPLKQIMAWRLFWSYALDMRRGFEVIRALAAYRRAHEQIREMETHGQDLRILQLQIACDRTQVPFPQMESWVRKWMEEEPLPFLERVIKPGLLTFLHQVKAAGFCTAVVSDYAALEKLQYLGIDPFFDVVISAQDQNVQKLKPAPDGLLFAAKLLGVEPKHALYIGDRAGVDDAAALAAGMKPILLGRHRQSRDDIDIVADYFSLTAKMSSLLSRSVS